jgi:hypothetical protein
MAETYRAFKGVYDSDPEYLSGKPFSSPNEPYAGFFSDSPAVASDFATLEGDIEPNLTGSVYPVDLTFKNPLVIDGSDKFSISFQDPSSAREDGVFEQYQQFLKAFGKDSSHDGVIIRNTLDEGTVYVPRSYDQIQSIFNPPSEPRPPDKSKLPAVIDAASVAAEAARFGADESRPKGKGAAFRGLGSLARAPIFKVARLVQEGYNLLPEDYKVIEDWVDYLKETQTHELFGMDKPGIEYLKEWLGMEQSEPEGGIITLPDLQKYIDLYHGTPNVWSSEEGYPKGRADLEYALTGEGVAAYGPGLYSAEVRDIARDEYRNPEGRHKLLSGQLEPKIEYAFSLLENEATASDVMNNMFNKYEGITFDTIMQSIDAARDEGAGKGALYKLQVPESVEKTFLDWDKPLSKQSGIVRKLIKASGMSRQELMGLEDQLEKASEQLYARSTQAGPEKSFQWALWHQMNPKGLGKGYKPRENWDWDEEALAHWDKVRKSNVAERKLGQFLKTMELDPGVKVKVPKGMDPDVTMDVEVSRLRGGDLLTAMGKDEKAVKLLDKAGIPGLRFLDQKSRGIRAKVASEPWPERTRNRVIWNQKLLNEVSRTLKREMAAGGFVDKPLYDDARIGGMI